MGREMERHGEILSEMVRKTGKGERAWTRDGGVKDGSVWQTG